MMTPEEERVVDLLGEAWNLFAKLSIEHSADRTEFAQAIHAAQNIVLARPVLRQRSRHPQHMVYGDAD